MSDKAVKAKLVVICLTSLGVLVLAHTFWDHPVGMLSLLAALPPLLFTYYAYRLYRVRLEEGQHCMRQIMDLHVSTVEALALAIEAKDQTACDHSQRVQAYAVGLAQALGLEPEQVQAIREAAILHDIGKLAVPEHILRKPGVLTPQELDKISVHPLVGYQILSTINSQHSVAEIVLCHHERWDGAGYPNLLRAGQIPIGARILALADCFEALTARRHHRKARSLEEATAHILAERGKAFDPAVVDAFFGVVDELRRAGDAAVTRAHRRWSHADSCEVVRRQSAAAREEAAPPSVYQAISAANQEISDLYDLAQAVGTTLGLNETLGLVAGKVLQMLPSSAIAVYLVEGSELVPRYVQGVDESLLRGLRITPGDGVSGWVAANRQPVLNAAADLELVAGGGGGHTYLQSVLAVPLVAGEQLIGVLSLYDLKPNRFEVDSLRLLELVSRKIALALRNSILFEQAHQESLTDPLTGLPNSRFLFMRLDQEIARARRQGASLTVLAMDLDNFKPVNDTLGHQAGDRVLSQISQLLRSCLREYDFVARTGGDEFVALLIDIDPESVRRKIEQIRQAVSEYRLDGKEAPPAPLGISIGCAAYGPDGQDTDALLAAADAAMYRAKGQSKQAAGVFAGQVGV